MVQQRLLAPGPMPGISSIVDVASLAERRAVAANGECASSRKRCRKYSTGSRAFG